VANSGGNVELVAGVEEDGLVVEAAAAVLFKAEGLLFPLVCQRRFAVKLSVGSMMAGGPTKST